MLHSTCRRVSFQIHPANRHARKATWFDEKSPHPSPLPAGEGWGQNGRWRVYDYAELMARDKASLDILVAT